MSKMEIKATLEMDGSGFDKALRKAEEGVNHFGNETLAGLKGMILEAFAFGAMEEFARKAFESTVKIKQQSEQFGESTDDVQKLARAAKDAGMEFEDVGRAFSKLGTARKEAGEHEGKALAALEKYGVTLADIRNPLLTNLNLMLKMREAMEELAKTAQGKEELKGFFGAKSGFKMAAVMEKFAGLGKITLVTPEDIAIVEKYEHGWSRLADTFGKLFVKSWAVPMKGASFMVDAWNDRYPALKNLFGDKSASPKNTVKPAAEEATTQFGYIPDPDLVKGLHEAEKANRVAGLTHEQKLLELTKERAEVLKRIGSETADVQLASKIEAVKLDTQIKDSSLHAGHGLGLKAGDSLTRTGNFLGASSVSIVSIGERTNHLLTQIHTTLTAIATKNGNALGGGATHDVGVPSQ